MVGGAAFAGPQQLRPPKLLATPQQNPHEGSLALRIGVHLRRTRLDQRLAEGADRVNETPQRSFSKGAACLAISRSEVSRARPRLMQICERLRAPDLLSPRAVAMCRRLLTDPASPNFSAAWSGVDRRPDELERRARAAHLAFDDRASALPLGDRPGR